MKQLIKIPARFLKKGDLIFDYKHRDLQKVDYVCTEGKNGEYTDLVSMIDNVHVGYGDSSNSFDNFKPDSEITIQINTDEIKIVEPENIGYR